ncbi:hypothetical protein Bca4012_025492 [Brassica carinata]
MYRLPPESSGLKPRPNQSGKRRKSGCECFSCKNSSVFAASGGGDRTAAIERPGLKKVSAKGRAAAILDRLPVSVRMTPMYLAHRRRTHGPCADATHLRNLIDQRMISSQRDHLRPHPAGILYVFSPIVCVTTRVPSIFRYGAGGSRWHGRKQTRTVIVCRSVHSCHPPRGPKFDSKAKEGDRLGHNKSVTARDAPPDLSVEAQHRQNEESVRERTIEPLEDPTHKETIVPDASTGEVSGVQKRLFPMPAPEKWRRSEAVTLTDVDYSQQEENRHERDLDPLGRGGRKHSIPVRPVDADERYDSCERISCLSGRGLKFGAADGETDSAVFEEFRTVLSENTDSTFGSIPVTLSTIGSFLTWLSLEMVDRREALQYFTKTILSYWSEFEAANDKLKFEWGPNIPKYVTGKRRWQSMKLEFGRDVYTVYAPMNWGGDHWVGLRIDLKDSQVMIYDSFVPHNSDEEVDEYLRPLIQSLPYILEKYAGFCSYQVKDGMRC